MTIRDAIIVIFIWLYGIVTTLAVVFVWMLAVRFVSGCFYYNSLSGKETALKDIGRTIDAIGLIVALFIFCTGMRKIRRIFNQNKGSDIQ